MLAHFWAQQKTPPSKGGVFCSSALILELLFPNKKTTLYTMPPRQTTKTIHLKANAKSDSNLRETILQEKQRGTADLEIGQKYGVTFKYIERLITQEKGLNVSNLKVSKRVKELYPKDFREEHTSVWSFKKRGSWATHSGEYRGNWSPYIPRNVILRYSKPGQVVLDYFCGAGTTAVEAKLLGRKCVAIDINENAIDLAKQNLQFRLELPLPFAEKQITPQVYEPKLLTGDARNLSFLEDNSINLICAHPPYANIVQYTDSKKGDLSFLDIDAFLSEMSMVAKESFRVLKPGGKCAILIGDTRRKKHVIPLGFKLMNIYFNMGFKLHELIIKRQHNCKTTGFWYNNSIKYNFLLLAHEYLPIFEKADTPEHFTVQHELNDPKLLILAGRKSPVKHNSNSLETTTVWLFPEKDFEERLNQNVVNRYSKGNEYQAVTFASKNGNGNYTSVKNNKKQIGLLFVKLLSHTDDITYPKTASLLLKVKAIINHNLHRVTNGGYIVIQVKDLRVGRFIEPLAKRMYEELTSKILWLREIIIVSPADSGTDDSILDKAELLKIAHQYLLVYEVRK